MAKNNREPSGYRDVLAEVYFDSHKGKKEVRPCIGESYSQRMNIECAKEIRNYPLGTKVRLRVVIKNTYGIKPHLYSSYHWQHEVVVEKKMPRRIKI